MRNLKKILALVLALVMSISVMSVASAKFEDSDKVNPKFATAVEVLNGLKVFQGYEDGTFNPTGAITRAEVAAIIYRIDTGDVTGKQVQIYSDYNKFDDVKSTAWYAGYVNYCANALYIKGYDEHTFGPNDKVTGYQALAMILRVIGYDKNNEFSGSAWQIETAKYAQRLELTKNVDVNTLGVAATRELVAELLFRAIIEEKAYQVDYNLLMNYYKVDEPIGIARFGLASFDSNDEWGRPVTGWTSNGKVIVYTAIAPLETYDEPVDQCTIVKDTGVKGNVAYWVNGVEGETAITSTHNVVNHIMGGQGTIVEVYANNTVVVIDTYLAVVTDTVKAAYDKNGHMYRAPYNEFQLFGAPVDYAFVDGNDFTNGDFWLVRYNEGLGYVEPYAVPTTLNAKQTYIWWNAEKHTINGDVYMDNANYALDYAGYDKNNEYTWFFDTKGNVIGSVEIIIPEAAKVYAVVLGAQWINAIGENGYALGKVQYLDGTAPVSAVIAKVDGNEMKYADTMEANFAAGTVCTTFQYNENTEAHLYEVKETAAGLELTAVTTDLDVVIYDGVSRIGNTNYYSDNNTVFFFYNAKTKAVDTVVGYDNLTAKYGYTCENVDVIVNKLTGFAQFVYIPVWTENKGAETTPDAVVVNKYVYITGDAMNYKLKDSFALLGVVDGEGNTDPLYFGMNYAGNEAATEAALNELVKLYQDMLCYVTITDGKVTAIAPVALDAVHVPAAADKQPNALYVAAGDFYFIGTGVMMLEDGTALNVNHNTVVVNEGKVGYAVNNMDYVYGSNVYVIYEGTTAKAIFVTNTEASFIYNGVEMTMADAMVMTLNADDFADVSASFTYDVTADAEVKADAIAEAVLAGTALSLIDGLYSDDEITVEIGEIEMLTDYVALVEVTVASANATQTVEIVVVFAEPAEDAE